VWTPASISISLETHSRLIRLFNTAEVKATYNLLKVWNCSAAVTYMHLQKLFRELIKRRLYEAKRTIATQFQMLKNMIPYIINSIRTYYANSLPNAEGNFWIWFYIPVTEIASGELCIYATCDKLWGPVPQVFCQLVRRWDTIQGIV